jgi:tRNA dimethylallyltransferase
MKNRIAIVIAGPTAVGKTEVAIRVANALHTDIISADSRQVYRELIIGTSVPEPSQLKSARHHLLQHRSIKDYYNASIFEMEALEVLEMIFRKKLPAVIAGGSGLYIQAICEGIDDIPTVDPEIRRELQQRLKSEGLANLRFELKKLDPLSYQNMDLKNPNRILKALEVTMMTGRPYSSFLTHAKKQRDFRILKIGLNLERDILYERINKRVDEMMEKGLLEEVRALLPLRDANALNTVGYKELFDHLDGRTSLEEAVSLIKRNTRHYARRQITWFKKDPGFRWFEPARVQEIIGYIGGHVDSAG